MPFLISGRPLQGTSSKGQHYARQHPCMASASLHYRLMQFRYHGVAKSTRRTYQSGLMAYMSFCSRFGINPLPATSLTLQYFCTDRSQSISYKTIKVYLAAIRLMHIEQGLLDPTTDQSLHLVCRGIRRQQNTPERKRLPITIDILKALKSQLRLSNYTAGEQHMLWSAFTLSFYGFLRASECLSLTWSEITIDDNHVTIKLHQSKTDIFRRGQSIHIYSTDSSTCPVRALKLFATTTDTKASDSHVFSAGTFSPLTRSKLTEIIRCLLVRAGMRPFHYASHSFRIGAATTAAAAGLPTWLIKTLGRWSSNAYLTYVHCPISVIASVPKTLSSAIVEDQLTWNPDS